MSGEVERQESQNGEPRQLPGFLTYYLETEAVTEDHVRRAAKLRNIYGPELLSKPFTEEIRIKGAAFVDSPETALEVLSEACPKEVSFYIYGMPRPSAVVMEGGRVFADHVSRHKGYLPQWIVAAFWWLSNAVDGSFSVDDLSVAIERWYGAS